MSNVLWYVPDVTPVGNPANLGTVVATIALAGGTAQQWMCEAVVPELRPLKAMSTVISLVAVFHVTDAVPVPGVSTAGFSLAPLKSAVKWYTANSAPPCAP